MKIADPDLDDGDNVYKHENFDLWQVKGGAMLDNVFRSGGNGGRHRSGMIRPGASIRNRFYHRIK